jgi:nicotinamidase-related amidase
MPNAFLTWLDEWHATLAPVPLTEIITRAGGPERVAVLVVDLLVGFCSEGPLAGARVGALVPKTAPFLERLHAAGIRSFVIGRDAHPENSPEFQAFPPHCMRGTREAELEPPLESLPSLADAVHVPKGSLNVALEEAFQSWHRAHPEIAAWIVIGDCTDLCVYNSAMYLRTEANTRGVDREVWVPADLVDTFDVPLETARQVGALPHDGELLHRIFLYHMALNGIRVQSRIDG